MTNCNHKLTKHIWRDDVAVARICAVPQAPGVFGCGAWLSLGRSNDTPDAVELEIRAAEIVQDVAMLGALAVGVAAPSDDFSGPLLGGLEREGWIAHMNGAEVAVFFGHQAGWLAREAFTAVGDLDGIDQSEPAMSDVELAEAADIHDEPTDPGVEQESQP